MNIKLKEVTVGELVEGYVDNKEDGVIGGGGKVMSDQNYNVTITCDGKTLEKIEGYLALLDLMEHVDFNIEAVIR